MLQTKKKPKNMGVDIYDTKYIRCICVTDSEILRASKILVEFVFFIYKRRLSDEQ